MFDLYGTLVDIHTDEIKNKFWESFNKSVLKFHNYSPTVLQSKYLNEVKELSKYKEEIEILDVFKNLFKVDDKTARRIALAFRRYSTEYIKLYKGVKGLLRKLKKDGFNIYLLSNAQESFTVPELKKLGILKYFNGIAISSTYGVKKPNKDFYLRAMKDFKIDKALMIGNDYECDIAPAKKLGLKTIFIESNLTPEHPKVNCIKGFDKDLIYRQITRLFSKAL